ncbi:ECF transporter S component [Clostridioides difficile]|nr:ECF transporter S component [Clostridioides difficile]
MCVKTITLIAFGISINIIGAFIAMGLRLPVYLDSIGTIMIASLLGPKYAVVTGVFGSLISGITFDVYSLYFAPVQISTGLLAGIAFKRIFKRFKNSTRSTFICYSNIYNKFNNFSIFIWRYDLFRLILYSANLESVRTGRCF